MIHHKKDYFKPLEECSKEIIGDDDASEYDTMLAISRMPDEFTDAELDKEIHSILLNRAMSKLIDEGLVEVIWNKEINDFQFYSKSS